MEVAAVKGSGAKEVSVTARLTSHLYIAFSFECSLSSLLSMKTLPAR